MFFNKFVDEMNDLEFVEKSYDDFLELGLNSTYEFNK